MLLWVALILFVALAAVIVITDVYLTRRHHEELASMFPRPGHEREHPRSVESAWRDSSPSHARQWTWNDPREQHARWCASVTQAKSCTCRAFVSRLS